MSLNDNRYSVKSGFQWDQPISYNRRHSVNYLSLSFDIIVNNITSIRLESKYFKKGFFPLFLGLNASTYIYNFCDPSPTKQDKNCLKG